MRSVDLELPCRGWATREFDKYAAPAPFGKAHQTVYDTSYRLAKEIKVGQGVDEC